MRTTRILLILVMAGVIAVAVGPSTPSRAVAVEAPCQPGHNTVVPPCSFDGGRLSLDAAALGGQAGGGGAGHQTQVSFDNANPLNPIIEILAAGAPFSSDESTTPFTLTLQVGACGPDPNCSTPSAFPGLALNEISLALVGATGDLSMNLSSASLGASITCTAGGCVPASGHAALSSPVGIISDAVLSGSFGPGGGSIVGVNIDFGVVTPGAVPEPSTLLLAGIGLGAIGALSRRRRH